MDRSRIKGAAQKLKGSFQKTVGKLTGNKAMENDGEIDKSKGAINTAVGKTKDALRGASNSRGK